MILIQKFTSAQVVADATLGPRQIRVIANSGKSDRVKDILVAKGCKLDNYLANPIVLANHDPALPVANFAPEIKGDAVEGIVTFAPQGISAKADEYCGLYKAGVLKTVSVGFNPIEYEAIDPKEPFGGFRYKEWELMELSLVAVPCDPGALVISRSVPHPEEARSAVSKGATWKCGASRSLPVSDKDSWGGPAAEARIFEHADFDGDSPDTGWARKAFLAYDSANPKLKGSYKLPFADVIDGRLTAIAGGLHAAASRISGTDIPDDVKEKGHAVLDHYKAKAGESEDDGDGKSDPLQEEIVEMETKILEDSVALAKSGRAISAENAASLDKAAKCMDAAKTRIEKCVGHVKAANDHMVEGRAHLQAIQDRAKPEYDNPVPEEGDGDNELALAAARRKRVVDALALADAP